MYYIKLNIFSNAEAHFLDKIQKNTMFILSSTRTKKYPPLLKRNKQKVKKLKNKKKKIKKICMDNII